MRKTLVFVLLVFLSSFIHGDFGQSESFFIIISPTPIVNITALAFSPSTVYQGSLTDITVTLRNTGGSAALVSTNVSIYDPLGAFVENVSFTAVLVPSLATVQETQSYSTVGRDIGNHSGVGQGFWTYDGTD